MDGHCARFVSRVASCEECEGGYDVRLERTAFFPGGGGQEADSGTLGGMRVLALRETEDGDIAHILPAPLEPGARPRARSTGMCALRGCSRTPAST